MEGIGRGNGKSGTRNAYVIGYGKPPKHSQFKPGQSGYPKGRPKGSRNRVPSAFEDNRLRGIISEEANQMITVTDANGRKTRITSTRGVVRAIKYNALKGQQRAQKLYVELVGEIERLDREERYATFETWAKYKRDWGPAFKGISRPDQYPHPDDVIIDVDEGVVRIAGPATKDEVPIWERWRKIRVAIQEEVDLFEQQRSAEDFDDHRTGIEKLIAIGNEALMIVDLALGGTRELMKFLKRLELPDFGEIQPIKKRLKKGIQFVLVTVYPAMRRQAEAEAARERRRF